MADGAKVLAYLREQEFFVAGSGLSMVGPRAEKEFGQRHFMELLSTFVADLELRVVAGVREIGFVSPLAIPCVKDREQRPLVLAGRGWLVQHIDWERFTVWVEEIPTNSDVKWPSGAVTQSFEACQAKRQVLIGAVPDVELSKRVPAAMERLREDHATEVMDDCLIDDLQQRNGHPQQPPSAAEIDHHHHRRIACGPAGVPACDPHPDTEHTRAEWTPAR